MSGLGRLETAVSSLWERFGPAEEEARPPKRRRVEAAASAAGGDAGATGAPRQPGGPAGGAEVAGAADPADEPAHALALAHDSPFVAALRPHALHLARTRAPAPAPAPAPAAVGHPPLEWVGICAPAGGAEGDAPASSETPIREAAAGPGAGGEWVGSVDIVVKWTLEDADLLLVGDDEAEDAAGDAAAAEAADAFHAAKQLAASGGLHLEPAISFRLETFRVPETGASVTHPVLVCKYRTAWGGLATLFWKPLVYPYVRLSTTGRYDSGLPMSVVASDVAVPNGQTRRHRPAPTLLHAIYNLARQAESADLSVATHDPRLAVTYSAADDCLSFHLSFPLLLPMGTSASLSSARAASSSFFSPLTHDLFNHLLPARPSGGRPQNREPRLDDLGGEVRDLYAAVLPSKNPKPRDPAFRQPAELECALLPFQRRAVQWMLAREGVAVSTHGLERAEPPQGDVTIREGGIWEKFELPGNPAGAFWIERMTGAMRRDGGFADEGAAWGGYGILAEEMGLGKTVELLSLVLAHRAGPQSQPPLVEPCSCGEDVAAGDSRATCSKCSRAFHASCVGNPNGTGFACADCKGKGKKAARPRSAGANVAGGPDADLPFLPATLIVTPQSILAQWIEEIAQHAPSTNVVVYSGVKTGLENASDVVNGMKPKSKRSGDDGVPDFAAADVVLTTYEVLQKEVWHAKDDSARERRYERRYERKTSPLVASRWWRVCLDEAQRVESGVSKAAEMVGLIPRVHAWVVTGTPIGKAGIQDLEGLFLFLKQPRTLSDHLAFRRAMLPLPSYRNNLLAALGIIMHRNSKEHVKEDLTIPAQEEHIFPVNLKEVEREYYLQRLELCLEDMKSVLSAADVDSIGEVDRTKLGKWLTTLRQTCVHPQIGAENKRALGSQLIKSINDVLVWMVRQCSSDLTTAERQLVGVQIRRAQALEQRKAFADALKLYQNLLIGVEKSVAEARKELAALREEADARSAAGEGAKAGDADSMVTEEEDEATKEADDKLSAAAGRLAAWLEVEHRLVYFIACVHNTLKEQALEDQFYDRAESIRQEILGPRIKEVEKAKKRIDEAAAEAGSAGKNDLHIAPSTFKGGIVTQELMMQVDATVSALNKQSATMMAWRKKVLDVLTTDLDYAEPEAPQRSDPAAPQTAAGDPQLANGAGSARSSTEQAGGESASDEASGSGAKKPHGNEYQTSLKLQEDANVYQDAYNEALLDRITLLSGAPRPQEGTIHLQNSSDLLKQLYKERTLPKGLNNLKGLAASLRAHVANKPNMPETEAMLCQNELRRLNKEVDRNMKLIEALQKESRLMTKLQNARIEYFRALQDLSDSVEPGKFTEGDIADSFTWAIKQCAEDEKKLKSKIVQLDGRKKYLLHLSEETPEGEARVCVICRDEYNNAAITPCAHFFCLPCLTQWVNQHRKCPTCNSTMAVSEINRVSFNSTKRKSDELTLEGVIRRASSFCDVLPATSTTKVQKIHLLGSFGSKLDTIVRHIMSLDKGEKVVLFSQWEQVLDFLANGLAKNGIHYVRFQGSQRNRAAVQFRRNPEIRVFILHAKSQSSGLTLVNATHVMIVEPILHPGVELQAINRVHRIGQTRTTHVWRYLVANTIEEGLFELYETRRMALSGKAAAAQDADAEEDLGADVENARMLPLASRGGGKGGGGEVVGLGDIVSLLKGAFSALERDEEVALADKEH